MIGNEDWSDGVIQKIQFLKFQRRTPLTFPLMLFLEPYPTKLHFTDPQTCCYTSKTNSTDTCTKRTVPFTKGALPFTSQNVPFTKRAMIILQDLIIYTYKIYYINIISHFLTMKWVSLKMKIFLALLHVSLLPPTL